ncbi:MAG: SGNH/GDSL hydrolase family protein [Verrucomicrobiota bacterium]
MIPANSTILFQGDSITDAGRDRNQAGPNAGLGTGYALMTAATLLASRPADKLKILNRGISGNRIVDLYARIKSDVINLKPAVLSVLIGVNDTWHEFGSQNGVPVPKYERIYTDFLIEVEAALPDIKLVLCEPFVLPCGVVTKDWVAEMDERRAVVKKLSQKFSTVFVPFQTMFDAAQKLALPEYWAGDGVHPSAAGHQLMAQAWLKEVTGK